MPPALHVVLEANLRRLAYAKGLTLAKVAEAVGLPLERLLAIFSGNYDPDIQLVGRIAEALDATASELLDETVLN